MRILHIVPKLDIGGIESMLYNYYSLINGRGIKWDFIVHGNEIGVIERKLSQLGCNIYHITPKKENIFKYLEDLRKIYNNNYFDGVHAHQSDMCFLPLMIAKMCRIKVRIAHAHTCMGDYENTNFKRAFIHYLNKLMATNFAYCGIAAKKWSFGEGVKGKWIPNGIDVNKFKYNNVYRYDLRTKYSIGDEDIVIGMVCRLSPEKNLNFSLEILKEVLEKDNTRNYKLFIVGDGDSKKTIKKYIEKLGLSENIVLVGRVEDSYKYYSFFDIFLLPSYFEGFPVSLIEAQCSSLFSIISNKISNESTINNNIMQCGIDKTNIGDWVNLIINYKKDKRPYNKTLDQFDIYETAENLIRFYDQIISRKGE